VRRAIAIGVALLAAVGCKASPERTHAAAPATLVPPTSSEGLASVALPHESQRALGLETVSVERVTAPERSVVAGEVMVPPGRDIVLSAPTGGRIAPSGALPRPGEPVRAGQPLMSLIPMAAVDRNARASAARDIEAARANYELTESRVKRALFMTMDGSGSKRAVEDARAQREVAHAELKAAESRLRTLSQGALDADVALAIASPVDGVVRALRVAPGQSVPSGASLIDVAGTGRWVRASLSAAEAHAFEATRDARARRVGADEDVSLAPVLAPPSADPLRGTIDRFFVLPPNADWTPGERILVELSQPGTTPAIAVPCTALVRDAEGGAWVYEQTGPEAFRRRRVQPIRREGARYLVANGLAPDSRIVSVGAVELWGFELGADR